MGGEQPGQGSPYGPPTGSVPPSGGEVPPPVPPVPAYGTPPGYPVPPPGYGPGTYPPPPGYGPPPGYYPPPGYAPGPYAYANPTPASMIVLVVLSAIAAASCYFSLAGIPAVILGAIALNTNRTDPQRAQHLARIGWIVFGAVTAFIVVAIVVAIVVGTSGG